MYSIYEKQRRSAIDEDLHDFADFLTTGLGDQQSDMTEIFNEMVARKDKPSMRQRSHRFVLASNDSIIFESNIVTNLDSLLNTLEERNEFSFKSIYNTVSLNNTEYRTYTRPIKLKPKKEFKLIIFTSMDKLYESLHQLRTVIIIVVPISLFFAGFIGFFIARRAFAPVRAITETAASISSKSLEKRVPISGTDDEISKLALTFNAMIARLHDTFISQQRFVADASHDLRTPLTVIQMELEWLLTQDEPDLKTKIVIDRCLKEILRLTELADNLMLLARADAHQLQVNKIYYRLDEQIMESVTQMKTLANQKNVTFKLDINAPVEVFADESMLMRLLINAIDNAIKYSPDNGKISIVLDQNEGYGIFNITNEGNPIKPESLNRIFDRFQRGEKARTSRGFGLGLAIIRAIAQVHNGDVTIQSDKENGTNLRVSIPCINVQA